MTKTHAEYQAIGRARRLANKLCRQCKEPAARRPDGTPYSMCNKHLDADAERKRDERLLAKIDAGKVDPSE